MDSEGPFGPSTAGNGHPRPQLQRDWRSLNGGWDFALDPHARWSTPAEVRWSAEIEVPFAPETARSGVGHTNYFQSCWYRRSVDVATVSPNQRLLLHFGAVDYVATVWVDGVRVAEHEGGYTPFAVDLTPVVPRGVVELVVRAEDDPHDLAKPRGKQDWQRHPHSIWYPRTTGIWQTVWLEEVHPVHISHLRWTPSLARWELDIDANIAGSREADNVRLAVKMRVGDLVLADDQYLVSHGEVHRRIALSDPGIDDSRNGLLWSPSSPTLIDVELEVTDARGEVVDRAQSYAALRAIDIQGDRIVLNGRPFPLRLVLDQGYWPDTGLTAPDDDALRTDVELAKAMGFNGVRKHQKIEDPRYLYWADRLGLLVWAEMPSAYRFTRRSVERTTRQWVEVIERDYSHPCIMAWVPVNESWGVPNLPESAAERHYVKALYHLTKTLDPSRPTIGNDGWESVATDIIGIHDYDESPASIQRRYRAEHVRPRLFRRERPGGRMLVLGEDQTTPEHPLVLSEFGGIALLPSAGGSWGYSQVADPEELLRRYTALLDVIRRLELLAGFCYTQFADTYQEVNGLLYADRTPKMPLSKIAAATRGPLSRGEEEGKRVEPLDPAGEFLALPEPEEQP